MDIEELRGLLRSARWFEHLGEFRPREGVVCLPNLEPWRPGGSEDPSIEAIADSMDWLPSSRDQRDPVHGRVLEEMSQELGKEKEMRKLGVEIYKLTLTSLRAMRQHPLLKVGPHDLTGAARGAALFASRRALAEILVGRSGFWCSLIPIYHSGYWPCGLLADGRTLVVL